VTKADPKNLLSATTLPLKFDTVSLTNRLDLAEAACYYSGNCQLAPYNGLRGNPYFNVDARLAKNFKLGEGRNLQLIFQAFDLFNNANYGNSFDNLVGTLNSAKTAVAPNAGFGNPNNFINPTNTVAARSFHAEFGAKFTF